MEVCADAESKRFACLIYLIKFQKFSYGNYIANFVKLTHQDKL
jgi:hypothetical protein